MIYVVRNSNEVFVPVEHFCVFYSTSIQTLATFVEYLILDYRLKAVFYDLREKTIYNKFKTFEMDNGWYMKAFELILLSKKICVFSFLYACSE